ncbi:TolB family protein [Streptomyces venezuelae]|uniref:TolB family protein n=1 Tax=Streptomyces venezuelae TaxID=54571 RepID=UPI0037A9D66E
MTRARTLLGGVLIAALLASTTGYVLWRRSSVAYGQDEQNLRLQRTGTVVYVSQDGGGRVRQVTRTGRRLADGPTCRRAAVAASTLICLRALAGPMSSEVRVYAAGKPEPTLRLDVWGDPSRARVSPSGNLVAWTVFRSGDSYAKTGRFSTTAGMYDLRNGTHYGSLEDFRPFVDGKRYTADDANFWGITFAADDRTFYATMGSRGRTYLVRGDLRRRTLTAIHQNVECPSLAPDAHRLAYKKRVDGRRWRLHVLDLERGTDTALAEHADVDDQPAWLDGRTIAYAKRADGAPRVFAVPADGSGSPRRLFTGTSPSAVTG